MDVNKAEEDGSSRSRGSYYTVHLLIRLSEPHYKTNLYFNSNSATWIINVFSASDPSLSQDAADEYGTLAKVRILDHGWNLVLHSLFPDASDLERAEVLDFGVGHDHLVNILTRDHGGVIDSEGIQSLTRVLHGVRDSLGVEFCPLMPDLCCLLLSHMPVS